MCNVIRLGIPGSNIRFIAYHPFQQSSHVILFKGTCLYSPLNVSTTALLQGWLGRFYALNIPSFLVVFEFFVKYMSAWQLQAIVNFEF